MILPSVCMCYLLMLILIVPMHGDTDLGKAIFFSCLYMTQSLALSIYESNKGFLVSVGDTKSLRYGGLFGIIVRIPIVLLSLYTVGIYGFALATVLDFSIRGLYYSRRAKRYIHEVES